MIDPYLEMIAALHGTVPSQKEWPARSDKSVIPDPAVDTFDARFGPFGRNPIEQHLRENPPPPAPLPPELILRPGSPVWPYQGVKAL
jgi:hypothetical protein